MSDETDVKHVWLIKSYAYVVLPKALESPAADNDSAEWHSIDSKDIPLKVHLSGGDFTVYAGQSHILEYFQLRDVNDHVTAQVLNDVITFTADYPEKIRKFRLEFGANSKWSVQQQCQHCVDVISKHFHLQNTNTQSKSLPAAESNSHVDDTTKMEVGESGGDVRAALPIRLTSLLELTIEKCLMDPNFPSFVDAVQHHLDYLTKHN